MHEHHCQPGQVRYTEDVRIAVHRNLGAKIIWNRGKKNFKRLVNMKRKIILNLLCLYVVLWAGGCKSGTMPTSIAAPVTETPVALPTVSPVVIANSTPLNVALDLTQTSPPNSARPAWRALLAWPDDCELGFTLVERQPEDAGGIEIYPVADEQYLIFVACTLGPYWVEERLYWLDTHANAPIVHALSIPEVQPGTQGWTVQLSDMLHGLPLYDSDTQTLRNLAPARGLKDCGTWYLYQLEAQQLVLTEARYQECAVDQITATEPATWPLIYPKPAESEWAGPFRRVAPVVTSLGDWIIGLEALPAGGLRLMTALGYATFHDGVWTGEQRLPEGHILVGVDAEERAWLFSATGETIYYQHLAGELTPANAGWIPVEEPRALERQGVVSDHLGQVWLATDQDVRVFDGARWTVFTREALGMLPATDPDFLVAFTLTFVPERKQLWVGACDWGGPGPMGGGGARWFDGLIWHGTQSPVAGGCVTAIAADAEGRVWIGMDHGQVWNFDQTTGNWQQLLLPEPEAYRRGYPVALTLDSTGAPWLLAALCGGASCDANRALYYFQDNVWIEIPGVRDYSQDQLYSGIFPPFLLDRTGTPWLFLLGEVVQIGEQQVMQPPAAALHVQTGTVDALGQLWVVGRQAAEPLALWELEPDSGAVPYP